MPVETRQGSTTKVLATVSAAASSARRTERFAHERAVGHAPVEIAFLAAQGVPPGLLLKAAAKARSVGVTADRALLSAGFPEDTFYRLLARHLGMPYLDQPLRLALPFRAGSWAGEHQVVGLAPNARNLDRVVAPRGIGLRMLLDHCPPGQGRGSRTAIVSPRCLKALMRRQNRPALLFQASHGLGSWDESLSASSGFAPGQTLAGIILSASLAAALAAAPLPTLLVTGLAISLLFLASVLLRLAATAASPEPSPPPAERIADQDLPVYTIIVPLLREADVVGPLRASLDNIDYPSAKLDIKLMVEAGDDATIAAIEALNLPVHFATIVAPAGFPRTKPRALNIGLHDARGAFLVVYDAEDRPDPGQLRAAVATFRTRPARTACLQARLAVDHIGETWLTRMFALEYAALFGVVMPGLAALKLPIPLGGTSNHFRLEALRRVNGWDSFNVTEDIDIGFRLARFGFHIEALDSVTFEEAPVTLAAWLPQRTRWLKGWMVTLMVHTRQPIRLWRELGAMGALSVGVALFGTILGCLFGPAFCVLALLEAIFGAWLSPVTPWQALAGAASGFLLVTGVASALWPIWLGLRRARRLDLAPWLLTIPAYLCLVSLAAWQALHEAIVAPQRWNKTEHGVARQRSEAMGAP